MAMKGHKPPKATKPAAQQDGGKGYVTQLNNLQRDLLPLLDLSGDTWITPTMINGWTADLNAIQFMKDTLGFVHLRGSIKNSAGSVSNVFALPIGYRPGITDYYPVAGSAAAAGAYIHIDTAGNVLAYTGPSGSTEVLLGGGVNFLAEQ